MLEEQQQNGTIINDISSCLNRNRIDDSMLMFLHIYEELDVSIASDKDMTAFRNICIKKLSDVDFRRKLDIFYMVSSGEDGLLLFDSNVKDNSIYILDNELYKEIHKLKIDLNITTGTIKKELGSLGETSLDGFND